MRASAMAMSSSSNLCSGLVSALPARGPFLDATLAVVVTVVPVVATFATRAMSISPFDFVDSACQLCGLSFETSYQLRVLAPLGLGKLANYPTVPGPHVVEPDPFRQPNRHFVIHTRRWRRPRSSNQVLFLCGIFRQLHLEPGHAAALVCLQHPHVYTSIPFIQLIWGEHCSHPVKGYGPDRKQLQQISAYGQFLPHQAGGQTAFSVAFCPHPLPGPLPLRGRGGRLGGQEMR